MNEPSRVTPGRFALRSVTFRQERSPGWRRLESLVTKMEKGGAKKLTSAELSSLPGLYQATLSSLSVARAISLDRNLLEYLDSLCARAYVQVYAPRQPFFSALAELTIQEFPRAVRKSPVAMILSAVVFFAAAWAAFETTRGNHDTYFGFVSPDMATGRDFSASRESLNATLFSEGDGEALGVFSAALFANNTRVGLLVFAVGILGGLPSFVILANNGFPLGAMSALFHERALAAEWWSWILPHGITEILAILLCGGAGFLMAGALLFPGDRPRMRALSDTGPAAARIVSGTVLMFFVAGLIEGIFRQTVHDMTVRYSVAAGTFLFWLIFFALGGRRRS